MSNLATSKPQTWLIAIWNVLFLMAKYGNNLIQDYKIYYRHLSTANTLMYNRYSTDYNSISMPTRRGRKFVCLFEVLVVCGSKIEVWRQACCSPSWNRGRIMIASQCLVSSGGHLCRWWDVGKPTWLQCKNNHAPHLHFVVTRHVLRIKFLQGQIYGCQMFSSMLSTSKVLCWVASVFGFAMGFRSTIHHIDGRRLPQDHERCIIFSQSEWLAFRQQDSFSMFFLLAICKWAHQSNLSKRWSKGVTVLM